MPHTQQQPLTPRTPLPPVERHRRSRETLIRRVFVAIVEGENLAAIARRKHMPRVATFRRWLAREPGLRRRYETARVLQLHVLADEMVASADRLAVGTRGRHRIAAVKRQIEARKLWIKLLAETRDAGPREAAPGLSDEHIAILEAALPPTPPDGAPDAADAAATEPPHERRTAIEERHDPQSDTDRHDLRSDNERDDAADKHSPPTPFVPRWFSDDDLERPEPPYDPLRW